mgnify:CR=1 FL=1
MKKSLVTVLGAVLALPTIAGAADLGTARAALTRMEQASLQVTNLVNNAKAQNDAIKFSCLNDKATQIKSYVNAASQTIERAGSLTGDARSTALDTVIADAATVDKLREEATGCVGTAEAEAAEAKEETVVARKTARDFDALDPNGTASSLGDAHAPVLPAVQAPGAASPAR